MVLVTRLVTISFKWVHCIICKIYLNNVAFFQRASCANISSPNYLRKRLGIGDFLESRKFHYRETIGAEGGEERCCFSSEVIRDFKRTTQINCPVFPRNCGIRGLVPYDGNFSVWEDGWSVSLSCRWGGRNTQKGLCFQSLMGPGFVFASWRWGVDGTEGSWALGCLKMILSIRTCWEVGHRKSVLNSWGTVLNSSLGKASVNGRSWEHLRSHTNALQKI